MARTQIIAEPGVPQIVIAREFAAPRELLLRAHIEPQLLAQWLGPRELTMTVDRLEARDGGRWRYIHRDTAGQEYAFHGVFHGTPSPDGIVQTFEFEGAPGHVSLQTLTFEDQGGKTLLRTNAVFQSVEDRDGMLQSGMEQGVNDSMERLDELVARLAPAGEGAAGVAKLATLDAEGEQAMDQTNLDIYGSAPIPWSRALAQLEAGAAKASWLATTRLDGRPHIAGVGAQWVEGRLYFTSGAGTRKSRNLAVNPACAVALSLPDLDLVVEGTAARVTDAATLARLAERYAAQGWPATVGDGAITAPYSAPSAGPPPWDLYVVTPVTAFGVATAEPYGATRWRFS